MNETSVVVSRPTPIAAPKTWTDLMAFCEDLQGSDLIPKDFRNKPADMAIAISMGMEVGLSWSHALQSIAVINGRPSLWGDGALAVVRAHPEFEWMDENDSTETVGVTVIKRRNHPPQRYEFTLEMARQAKLLEKQTYKEHQKAMLQRRARARCMSATFSDALRGMGFAEEHNIIDVTPTNREIEPEAPKQPKAKEVQARLAARKQTEPGAAQAPETARSGADTPSTAEPPARAAGAVDEATGELFTVDQICEQLAKAMTGDQVKEAADLARSLKNPDDQARAQNAYKAAVKRVRSGE